MNSKKVIVTGGAGFIGSHLAEELAERDYQLIILDDLSTGKMENIEQLLEWEQVYNAVRPHRALGYVTPLKFLSSGKNIWKRGCVTNHMNEYNCLTYYLVSDTLPMV